MDSTGRCNSLANTLTGNSADNTAEFTIQLIGVTDVRISDAERFLFSMCNLLDRAHTLSSIVLISSRPGDRMRSNSRKNCC
ncbi:hypothetical protein EMIT0P258_120208 [Pseudomonas sp. IT-P258]